MGGRLQSLQVPGCEAPAAGRNRVGAGHSVGGHSQEVNFLPLYGQPRVIHQAAGVS